LLATKTVLFPTCLFFVMNMLFSGVLSAQKTDGASPFSFPPAPMIEAAADKSAAQVSAPAAAASGESSAKNQNAVSKQDSAKRNTAGKNADSASVSSQKETNTKRSVSEQGTAKKQPSKKIVPNKTESKTADKPKLIRYAFLNGTRYVNLHDVASFYGMMLHQYMKFIILKNKKHQVQFFLKSRKVILDSVQITFHFPMEKKNGSWYISELDFRTILNPISRQKLSVRSSLKTIMIDAGHGGKDSGAKGLIKNEKTINLEIAKKLSGKLEAMGFKVYLTRSNDIYPTLPERSAVCQKLKADLFISIHCNSHTKKNVSGIETF